MHAYVTGTILSVDGFASYKGRLLDFDNKYEVDSIQFNKSITYNPFLHEGFIVIDTKELITTSVFAKISGIDGIIVS